MIEQETSEYHTKIQEYIEDLKNKRGALDNIINDGDYLEELTSEQFATAKAWQQFGSDEQDMLISGGDAMIQNMAMWSQEEAGESLDSYVSQSKKGQKNKSGESPY